VARRNSRGENNVSSIRHRFYAFFGARAIPRVRARVARRRTISDEKLSTRRLM
jgi:hypothetical protein